uniref:Uncharacterized protein n=1 Tax=Oryza glumipatula TaxID=40148 RepID=A0A0D9YX17_9ORYZ
MTGACLSSAHGLHRLLFRHRRSAPHWRAIRRSQRPSSSSAAAVPPSSAGGLQIATIAHTCCPRPPPVEDAEEGQSENPDAASMQMRIILTTMYIETFIRIEIVVLIAHVHMACPSLVPQVRIKDTKGVFIHE